MSRHPHDCQCLACRKKEVLVAMAGDYPIISLSIEVQKAYLEMRDNGVDHKLAEMLALRSPPMSNTDREFWHGKCNGNQFEQTPWVGDAYRRQAEDCGVDPTGKVYISQLADYPGDPRAWVDGRGDVQRICEERGWGSTGSVNVKARNDLAPEPDVAIADDIMQDLVEDKMEASPGISAQEAKEAVTSKHKPHWAK